NRAAEIEAAVAAAVAAANENGKANETDSEDENMEESQPLAQILWDTQVPPNFKIPHLPTFDGKTDPKEHLMAVGTETAI
ncbi:hypothetical protein A2U01_0093520, partial [Trifolium medium]|nr:hypothetical protein [Trifolium medium]